MKKRLISSLLAAVMLLSACDGNVGNAIAAEQEEADVFESLSGLDWDMDYDEVLEALPTPNSKYEDNVRDMAGVSYNSVDFFGCDSKLDIYIQSNYGKRQLYKLAFTINTEDISGTYEKLKEMLTEKYGEYKQNTEFVSWEFINDNTTVSLSDWDNELVCSFVYVRKPLSGYYDTTTTSKTEDLPEEEQTKEEKPEKKLTLQDLTIYEYRSKSLAVPDHEALPFSYTVKPGDYYTKFLDNNTISFEDVEIKLRESTKGLAEGKDNRDVISKVKSAKMKSKTAMDSPYIIDTCNPEFKLSVAFDKSLKLEYVKTACSVVPDSKRSDFISVNGFIRKRREMGLGDALKYTYEIIIDPAYMYGIPLLTTNPGVMNFSINGKDITADTIMLETDSVTMKYVAEDSALRNIGEDFVYGRIKLSYITLSYYNTTETKQEGYYKNKCGITGFEIYTEDTAAALENPYMISIDKDAEMTAVYNAIINEKDKLMTENTYGIVLLDMDFDGYPEVLHTKLNETEDGYGYGWISDIDIYRIKEGALKYIDTIYNVHQAVYTVSNLLGLKILEDGSKAWFSTSYKNRTTGENNVTDYLYTLNGDKLEYTELFTKKPTGEQDEYGNYEYKYYFKGSEIVPTVIKDEIDEDNPPMSDTHYEWNGAYSYLGVMWELYGKAREQYTSDIEISYKTYSDWLSNIYTKDYNDSLEKYTLTDREFSYNIAYLVDEFFLGTYNSAELEYNYYFLGDYAKPVIYLYPEEETEISVAVDFKYGGELTCTYPEYNNGWQVTAEPDGTLYDKNGEEYYCLYWEAEGGADFDNSKGFCVKGEDTAEFLREKLMYIGLTAREANEFIIYWLPKMQDNEYNVITLHTADYADSVPLTVSPAPDTNIRVFMTYYPSEKPVKVQEQVLPHFERKGFTLVEWGGSEY